MSKHGFGSSAGLADDSPCSCVWTPANVSIILRRFEALPGMIWLREKLWFHETQISSQKTSSLSGDAQTPPESSGIWGVNRESKMCPRQSQLCALFSAEWNCTSSCHPQATPADLILFLNFGRRKISRKISIIYTASHTAGQRMEEAMSSFLFTSFWFLSQQEVIALSSPFSPPFLPSTGS